MTTGLVVKRTYGVFLLGLAFSCLVYWLGSSLACGTQFAGYLLIWLFCFGFVWLGSSWGLVFGAAILFFFPLEVCMAAFVGKLLYCVMVIVGWDRWLFTTTSC